MDRIRLGVNVGEVFLEGVLMVFHAISESHFSIHLFLALVVKHLRDLICW